MEQSNPLFIAFQQGYARRNSNNFSRDWDEFKTNHADLFQPPSPAKAEQEGPWKYEVHHVQGREDCDEYATISDGKVTLYIDGGVDDGDEEKVVNLLNALKIKLDYDHAAEFVGAEFERMYKESCDFIRDLKKEFDSDAQDFSWTIDDFVVAAKTKHREQEGLRWVKATRFNYKPNSRYYACWGDGDGAIKSTGWFQQSDGTFFWNENGFVPVLKKEHDQLYILDESTTPVKEAGQPAEQLTIADYEQVLADNRRLVREIDVILNGDNAAKQASLCDLIPQIRELVQSRQQPAGESGWISIEDKPLYIDTALGWECTEDGEKDFIAAVPYWDTKGERKLCWWIRHCCFEDGTGLCVVGDDENIPAGWHHSAITHWKPWPAHPEQSQNNKP